MQSLARMTRIVGVFLVGCQLLAATPALADRDTDALERLVVEWARTPAQHATLAQHFRNKADEARDDARLHRRMLVSYSGITTGQRQRMKRHCRKLAANYTSQAQDYDAIAAFHEAQSQADE